MLNKRFETGRLRMTSGVNAQVQTDPDFPYRLMAAVGRYINGDWGDLYDFDKKENDRALLKGGRLLGRYNIYPDIYIITEHDRSLTTVLLPDEY